MKRIVTLGPKGTFSDTATSLYMDSQSEPFEVEYFGSIKNSLKSIGHTSDIGVLPIENLSEGFISLVLDHLISTDLSIIGEIILPIQFSFVSKAQDNNEIDELFVQFVAKGQCSEFIEALDCANIITTESNIESLNMALESASNGAAIVPSGSFDVSKFQSVIENITDHENNKTRFLVLSMVGSEPEVSSPENYKTSIVVLDDNDRPGLLSEILLSFSKREINLTSITSRPSGKVFGKYHFFIDLDGSISDINVADALQEISKFNKVRVMGSYPKAKIV